MTFNWLEKPWQKKTPYSVAFFYWQFKFVAGFNHFEPAGKIYLCFFRLVPASAFPSAFICSYNVRQRSENNGRRGAGKLEQRVSPAVSSQLSSGNERATLAKWLFLSLPSLPSNASSNCQCVRTDPGWWSSGVREAKWVGVEMIELHSTQTRTREGKRPAVCSRVTHYVSYPCFFSTCILSFYLNPRWIRKTEHLLSALSCLARALHKNGIITLKPLEAHRGEAVGREQHKNRKKETTERLRKIYGGKKYFGVKMSGAMIILLRSVRGSRPASRKSPSVCCQLRRVVAILFHPSFHFFSST